MKFKKVPYICLVCTGLVFLLSGVAALSLQATPAEFDHSAFTEILQAYVDETGGVDYQGIKGQAKEKLTAYAQQLENAAPAQMPEKERMAFYINAYNAFTLKLIADHYPLKSIREIPGMSGVTGSGQWKKDLWTLEGRKISLDSIEHKILRPLGDPRIHFALVCAAKSCPSLARRAYTGANLDELLNAQGRRFNQSPKGLQTATEKRFFRTTAILKLSPIYKWFKEDFLLVSENLPDFVQGYANGDVRAFIKQHRKNLKIEFLDYDWQLNGQP